MNTQEYNPVDYDRKVKSVLNALEARGVPIDAEKWYAAWNEADAKLKSSVDLPALIRRALGDEVFTTLADPTNASKADRDRRRSELNKSRQAAEAALHQAQDNLAAVEAQIAAFDRETTP